jgi:poly [ADP-ribose] polymerase
MNPQQGSHSSPDSCSNTTVSSNASLNETETKKRGVTELNNESLPPTTKRNKIDSPTTIAPTRMESPVPPCTKSTPLAVVVTPTRSLKSSTNIQKKNLKPPVDGDVIENVNVNVNANVTMNENTNTNEDTNKNTNDIDESQSLPATVQLEPKTREFIKEIFSKTMRNYILRCYNLDVNKFLLDGIPTKKQIENGMSILNEIEDKLDGGKVSKSIYELSSEFYSAIPHSFGRKKWPSISNHMFLEEYYNMCNTLLDIFSTNETILQVEAQQQHQNEMNKQREQGGYDAADMYYESLKSNLSLLDTKSVEYRMMHKYFHESNKSYSHIKLLNAWSVDRQQQYRQGQNTEHYQKFDQLDNKRLLWYATNIASVASTLTSGVRIKSRGKGRSRSGGINFACMLEKSAQYDTIGNSSGFACMFLCEVALGTSHSVTGSDYDPDSGDDVDGWSNLKKAPDGYDSVHTVGSITPKLWTSVNIDDKSVIVPDAKAHSSGIDSSFRHDEYFVYDEAQVRIRYVVTVQL